MTRPVGTLIDEIEDWVGSPPPVRGQFYPKLPPHMPTLRELVEQAKTAHADFLHYDSNPNPTRDALRAKLIDLGLNDALIDALPYLL